MSSIQHHFLDAAKRANMRLTPQKKAIYDALFERSDHPTAEELHRHLKCEFPTMSLATVYDNLRKFVTIGLCAEVFTRFSNGSTGAMRFDANMEPHHHTVDKQTGKIQDVYITDPNTIPVPDGVDHSTIKEIHITYIT